MASSLFAVAWRLGALMAIYAVGYVIMKIARI